MLKRLLARLIIARGKDLLWVIAFIIAGMLTILVGTQDAEIDSFMRNLVSV